MQSSVYQQLTEALVMTQTPTPENIRISEELLTETLPKDKSFALLLLQASVDA